MPVRPERSKGSVWDDVSGCPEKITKTREGETVY